jgi:hypothetical protein
VDYGDGRKPKAITVPHAWRQDLPVFEEGPVVYRCSPHLAKDARTLRFWGASYRAEVRVNGELRLSHFGIWDHFDVHVADLAGKTVVLEVEITKNGGTTFPVTDVASGFLPYVFHTFGGLFRPVEVQCGTRPTEPPVPEPRVSVNGCRISVDGKPVFLRGLLHWGWYPDLGHAHPDLETVRAEVRQAKALGFNLVKFCLWVPPHHYLQVLEEEGMLAWMELPLWNPSPEPETQAKIAAEIERIVRQYRHHRSIVAWTVGCELSTGTPPEYREKLVRLVKALTGCPLVKDNSGGSEMYGGDLREFGDFEDFHPYCDTPFYPLVLESLQPGPRIARPILLGEFNDIDVHRDLPKIAAKLPYWASSLRELNDQGVRWQYDLPRVLAQTPFAEAGQRHEALAASSHSQALFMRKFVHETVRAHRAISGYVVTGWRDTPISSAGFFDDWGSARFSPEECLAWNADDCLFPVPFRRPPWEHGGNRPGRLDPFHHFAGPVFFQMGASLSSHQTQALVWRVCRESGEIIASGVEATVECKPHEPAVIGLVRIELEPGEYVLEAEFGPATNHWPLWVVERVASDLAMPEGPGVLNGVEFAPTDKCSPMPFWREAAYEFGDDPLWSRLDLRGRWHRLLAICSDRAIELDHYPGAQVIIRRVDTRTYAEHGVLLRHEGRWVTSLCPWGGMGIQPAGARRNPVGSALWRALADIST